MVCLSIYIIIHHIRYRYKTNKRRSHAAATTTPAYNIIQQQQHSTATKQPSNQRSSKKSPLPCFFPSNAAKIFFLRYTHTTTRKPLLQSSNLFVKEKKENHSRWNQAFPLPLLRKTKNATLATTAAPVAALSRANSDTSRILRSILLSL